MRFVSLFAGIGGLDMGLERAGWECVAQVEREPFCLEVLAKHWPDVPRFTDVRTVSADNLPVADAIVGGFPCQPHSVAGKGLGEADERNLWPDYRRLVADIRPRWVVGENVPGLDRTMLADVVRDLEALGYEVGVLGVAASTLGATHRRERRFIVARLADCDEPRLEGRERSVLCERAGELPAWEGGASVGDAARIGEREPQHEAHAVAIGGQAWRVPCGASGRPTEPRVGDATDGLPGRLSGPGPGGAWPNPPGPQAEWEAPRVAVGVPNRAAKLKALGNAIVPQCAELVGMAVNALEEA